MKWSFWIHGFRKRITSKFRFLPGWQQARLSGFRFEKPLLIYPHPQNETKWNQTSTGCAFNPGVICILLNNHHAHNKDFILERHLNYGIGKIQCFVHADGSISLHGQILCPNLGQVQISPRLQVYLSHFFLCLAVSFFFYSPLEFYNGQLILFGNTI